jgi:acetoacetate decarboxylase
MKLELKVISRKNYLHVVHKYANLDLELALTIMREVAQLCKKHNLDKVLIDARDYVRQGDTLDFYKFSTALEEMGLRHTKIAVVPNERDKINKDTHFMENVAHNRGSMFRFFANKDDALAWLDVH